MGYQGGVYGSGAIQYYYLMMINNNPDRVVPDSLDKDLRAQELAKIALGWADMSAEQRMDASRALLKRAQEIKETL